MKRVLWVTALAACVFASAEAAPNLILIKGRVFTPGGFVQAVAIDADKIVAAGTDDQIIALAPNAKRISLENHLVIPGINDAHVHFTVFPPTFPLLTTPDSLFGDVLAAVAGASDETPPDIFITGTIGLPAFLDPNATRQAVDAVSGPRPVMLTMFTGHGVLLNTAAINFFGVSAATDPLGGKFERDANGALTGRVFEYAQYNLERKFEIRSILTIVGGKIAFDAGVLNN